MLLSHDQHIVYIQQLSLGAACIALAYCTFQGCTHAACDLGSGLQSVGMHTSCVATCAAFPFPVIIFDYNPTYSAAIQPPEIILELGGLVA
jgi:hypothetical protein